MRLYAIYFIVIIRMLMPLLSVSRRQAILYVPTKFTVFESIKAEATIHCLPIFILNPPTHPLPSLSSFRVLLISLLLFILQSPSPLVFLVTQWTVGLFTDTTPPSAPIRARRWHAATYPDPSSRSLTRVSGCPVRSYPPSAGRLLHVVHVLIGLEIIFRWPRQQTAGRRDAPAKAAAVAVYRRLKEELDGKVVSLYEYEVRSLYNIQHSKGKDTENMTGNLYEAAERRDIGL